MGKEVFAAVWPAKIEDYARIFDLNQKITYTQATIRKCFSYLANAAKRMQADKPLFLFVAPEYLFVKQINGANRGDWVAYESSEKAAIYKAMKQTSHSCERMIIIPGTVLWKKDDRHNFNTCPVFYKGSLYHEYNKVFDDGVAANFTPGTGGKTHVFTIKKIKFGLEVCGDFTSGNLQKSLGPGDQSIDIEIYPAATNPHSFDNDDIKNVPVKEGGYFIHCDAKGTLDRNGVWVVRRGGGWHGMATPGHELSQAVYAYSNKRLGAGITLPDGSKALEKHGVKTSPGTIFNYSYISTYQQGSTAKFKFQMKFDHIKLSHFNREQGTYTALVKVSIANQTDQAFPFTNVGVNFGCDVGTITPVITTDSDSSAMAIYCGKENHKATITAAYRGTTISAWVDASPAGPGNVSKLGELQPKLASDLACYYLVLP